MAKKKLLRFAEIEKLPNVLQFLRHGKEIKDFEFKGKWHSSVFKNNNPIVLELGCGKGEYSVGMAQQLKNKNFIGVDIKGNRMWLGAKTGLDERLNNLIFLRTHIESIDSCFSEGEIAEIWITFPDPQIQKPRARKRLTHPLFLNRYKKFLVSGGSINLKTDSTFFYHYTLETLQEEKCKVLEHTDNLYKVGDPSAFSDYDFLTGIQTYYEKLFTSKGATICYVKFTLNKEKST
jgi:tRNA (guanine-N7-)-methyltransferase